MCLRRRLPGLSFIEGFDEQVFFGIDMASEVDNFREAVRRAARRLVNEQGQ
jgi:hypothetical protein